MSRNIDNIKSAWNKRQKRMGNTKRSVLFKNLPDVLNSHIHSQHINFILGEISESHTHILDVGCGYGRISDELIQYKSGFEIEGVELKKAFSDYFLRHYGSCFNVSIQEFTPKKNYDLIIICTTLMYLSNTETIQVLDKLWRSLNQGGKIICIEPTYSFIIKARKIIKSKHLKPTGNNVNYYREDQLDSLLNMKGSILSKKTNISLLPILNFPIIHRAVSRKKYHSNNPIT